MAFSKDDYAMQVIGHENETIQRYVAVMCRNGLPMGPGNLAHSRRAKDATVDGTKAALMLLCANGDEIPAVF